jgi:hypothetical protein
MKGVIMNLSLSQGSLLLERDQTIGLVGAVGARVDVRRGKVWITQQGDLRDMMIGAGRGFTLDRPGLALVRALESSEFAVAEQPAPRPASLWEQVSTAFRRWVTSIFGPEAIDLYHPGPSRRYH